MKELTVFVTTYNEAPNVAALLRRVDGALVGCAAYEVVIVDDNGPDRTADVACSLESRFPVRVIVRENERGLASAVIESFRQAQGEAVGAIDADLQHAPEELPELLLKVREGADIVVASRHERPAAPSRAGRSAAR